MTTLVRRILLALTLVGLASSLASLYVHAQMLAHPGYLTFCDVNATFSCTTVYQSRYSMFWHTPVALFGAGYYVVVLLLLAGSARGPESLRENAVGHIFALSTVGLGVSLFLAYTSFFVIKAVCMMCLVTYGAVAGLFLVSGARTPYSMTTLPRRAWQDARAVAARPLGLTVVILFVVAAATAIAFVPRDAAPAGIQGQAAPQVATDRRAEFLRFWESQQRMQIPVPSDGAVVLVVRFSDFQCPSCGQTYKDYKPILAKYAAQFPGAVKLVMKDFPLERECNAGLARDLHYASCEAAVAARLAHGVGKGEAMEDWLYDNQTTLTPGGVRQAAKDIGGVTDYDERYASVIEQVKSDVGLASVLNIRVTPTFFVNGVRLEGGLPAEYFEMALQYELKKAGKMVP
jgi:uncharacterized membrane protein/protein-disulfide isomerase